MAKFQRLFLFSVAVLFICACSSSSSSVARDALGSDSTTSLVDTAHDKSVSDVSEPNVLDTGKEDAPSDAASTDIGKDVGTTTLDSSDTNDGCVNGLGGTTIGNLEHSSILNLSTASKGGLRLCGGKQWYKLTPSVGGSYIFLAAFFQAKQPTQSTIAIAIYGNIPKTSSDFDNALFFHGGVSDQTKGFAALYADLEANKTVYLVVSGFNTSLLGVEMVYDFEVTLPCSEHSQCTSGLKSQVLGTSVCHPKHKQCSDCKIDDDCANNRTGDLCQKDAGCSCRTDLPSSCPSDRYCRDDLSGSPIDTVGFCVPK